MISYKPFWSTIKKKKLNTYLLEKEYGFSNSLIDKLKHDKNINISTINSILNKLNIGIKDFMEYKKD